SVIVASEAVADYLRKTRKLKVGVVNVTFFRPFPGDLLGEIMKGRKGIVVLERVDQPLAEGLPLIREIRACMYKCVENATAKSHKEELPYPDYAVYDKPRYSSPLYSASHGLGSRDLQPEGIIGAVENMLKDGKKKKFFYLGVDFIREQAFSPKQEIHQESVEEAYPGIREMAIRGSENPNLLPKGSITVRIHSVGGWGAITTGKNLAMTLFDMMDYDIKANPKYGSEKKGQPTTYYLSAAAEPIPLNCEYKFVDVILSPDPNVFSHTNALSGLKEGGMFIIQSNLESPEAVWNSLPWATQKTIVDKNISIFYVDAFKIAKDEATDADLQFRMQGIAFQGAFFAASPIMANENLTEEQMFTAIKKQLNSKFGNKGERVVEDNFRVVTRGFEEVIEITEKEVADKPVTTENKKANNLPIILKSSHVNNDSASDIHRFWEQTGGFYSQGKGDENLVDPFMALSLMPAATGLFRDMTQIRFEHPVWVPEKCTACADCYVICPDSAIPGLVNSITEVFDTNIKLVEKQGHQVKHLRRAVRTVEKKLRTAITPLSEGTTLAPHFNKAINETIAESELEANERQELETEFTWFNEAVGDFKFALTKPYHDVIEKHNPGKGGLFSITIDPYRCKGCMECVTICEDEALEIVTQTPESVEVLRKDWNYWQNLPSTSEQYSRIDDLDECVGALETLLLEKNNHESMGCGDGACLGCGEKTDIHLFTGVVTALLQSRVKKHLVKLDELIDKLDRHIRLKLSGNMDLSNVEAINNVIKVHTEKDLTLSSLSSELDDTKSNQPVDPEWLKWVTGLLAALKHLKWQYTEGITGNGRSSMGFVNATGCTTVWGSTFPYNPYPFPWASHLFQDTPSMAMGLFEGHMAKMAEGFKAIRMAELEIKGEYDQKIHADFFARFNWKQFTDEEFHLCPPVVAVGGDGAMYDIGFQNLSRALMSGMPIKVLVLDTQVYSNTGGQACTSGFIGQVADMTPYGKEWKGKEEIRKEISLIGMAHRTSYVMQGGFNNVTHLLEGYIEGLNTRRPALWNIYAVCQPEHGVADDAAEIQTKLAVESRAYPLMKFNPDLGTTWEECLDLEGNPAMEDDWPTYSLEYEDESGVKSKLDVPLTFADFALTEGRFRKHF
ncbi:MAG: 2-oxoacid:acceptor oxidoreductase family protein, partial [Gammaproteobacteria bacterium]|nr:2-oxoacid:acceptor oxidoreductase family protein [Gammaproteobacteria bacterium]